MHLIEFLQHCSGIMPRSATPPFTTKADISPAARNIGHWHLIRSPFQDCPLLKERLYPRWRSLPNEYSVQGCKVQPLASVRDKSTARSPPSPPPPAPPHTPGQLRSVLWLRCISPSAHPVLLPLLPHRHLSREPSPKLPAGPSPSQSWSPWESNRENHTSMLWENQGFLHEQLCGVRNLLSSCPIVSAWITVTLLTSPIPYSLLPRDSSDCRVCGK